ncbi:proteasome assembly chaperone family protein [Paractinoplanes atraurantiacus]|uniref:Predicted ATP-dependent carboligase, ATP-grasp superfamily n=1 Tax=Paractinoplanes atraurantiacus TaxID=1036182 RepID=A0A285JKV7_9ACTN|nr:PAC2 family protein [Actinoplanes atraurantiacus]SNY60447.1 Predicted ATP-dependent carboligase, ATP-grasp superfamily [Actinoplanes atraurantiacus]
MLDPHELYELADDLPELDEPVLVQALTGFVDAGSAIQLARESLLDSLESRVIATFDVDQLLDYRSRRPPMIFVEDHWESYEEPTLALHLVRDQLGTEFLLLTGPEPDLQWERFITAVIALTERFGVRVTVGLNAIPMAVPHTRPGSVTAHATDKSLLGDREPWLQRVQVPGSVGGLLEFRLGEAGHSAMGYAAHVPHYLAQTTYPAAAELLLDSLSSGTGLALPTGDLREAARAVRDDVDKQIADDEQATRLVASLEAQYDAFLRGRETNLLADTDRPLPTAEELGAELERFLAEQGRDDS